MSKGLPTLSKLKTAWAKLKKYKYQEAGNKYVIQKLFGIIMYPKGKGKKKISIAMTMMKTLIMTKNHDHDHDHDHTHDYVSTYQKVIQIPRKNSVKIVRKSVA